MNKVVLSAKNITKCFGSFTANDKISLNVHKGEVLAILGENGAGKSTLMNILCGLYRPTSGEIFINGNNVVFTNSSDAVRYGIGMVHQHFMLIDVMTALENIILGKSLDKAVFINREKLKSDIVTLSQRYGLNIELDKPISEISVGARQRVEILKVLWRGAEILIFDEPTAVLTDEETHGLFTIIRNLVKEGKSVIFISHKLREVMEISDRILVLRHGKLVGEYKPSEVNEQILANAMVGRQLDKGTYVKKVAKDEQVLAIKNIFFNANSKHNGLNGVSFNIHSGEILGIAGVDGNGQSELVKVITGLLTPESGTIMLKGDQISIFDPMMIIEKGVSHIPEDRNRMGLVGDMTIKENLIMKGGKRHGFTSHNGLTFNKKNIHTFTQNLCERYDIRCNSIEQLVKELSGGNQQKVILARELEQKPDLLIAMHPTRGLDVGAAMYIHDRMIEARDHGCAVLLVSTDLQEILLMSDRIAVMFEGCVQGIFSGIGPPVEDISYAMMGKSFTSKI
jgi:ABC-type uncharacterized transport system ATPase subunit